MRFIINRIILLLLPVLLLSTVQACGSKSFNVKNVAKSDIDMVADAHLQEMKTLLRELIVKLYKRNPVQLQKQPAQTIELRLEQIFSRPPEKMGFEELDNRQGVDALLLSLDNDFSGDRVFALMVGLTGMINRSYNNKNEFFILDALDQQKLYNSARNIEILVWRLKNRRDPQDRLLLLTDGSEDQVVNLSYERLFGKMIAIQDMMARIVEDRTNRTVNRVVQVLATATFLPVL